MNEKKLNTEFTPSKDDFQLVQRDMKIKDQKFQTKTTTFAKDAFKRFCKNKSSVVGAIIIGILLLCSLIFPIVLPYNVNKPDPNQTLLIPKLFENNNGFWDGTKKYSNVVYNRDTQCPEGYHPTAVIKDSLVLSVDEVIDLKNADATTYQATAYGGYFKFIGEKIQEGYDPAVNTKRIENKTLFDITSDGGYYVNFSFGNVDIIQDGTTYTKQAKYKISLMQGKTVIATLKDWSDDYSDQSFDLSKVLSDNGKTELKGCSIKLEIYRDFEVETHVLIKQLIIGAKNVTDEEQLALLNEISINDPCDTFFMKKNDAGVFPVGYYSCSGRREVYQAKIDKCSFYYDLYEAALGYQTNFSIGETLMLEYVEKGWCEYDFAVGPSSFKKLSDKCPIETVNSQEYGTGDFENVLQLKCDVILYKIKGYDKMPSYILGTTKDGFDIVKLSFVSLRTSLLIAICVSAINLFIGLIWGSISGYFGGNIDLFMERITDILANIPFIVVMTLTILLLGNSILTFGLALCLTGWIGVAARTRTQFYRFKGREYILASRTLGASDKRLIFKHILPNALGTLVTSSVLMIPGTIFSEASVSYLGLGLKGVTSFGTVLSDNQNYLQTYPALIVFPAIIVSLLMISFNLFGNGLRDALNPSLKGSE